MSCLMYCHLRSYATGSGSWGPPLRTSVHTKVHTTPWGSHTWGSKQGSSHLCLFIEAEYWGQKVGMIGGHDRKWDTDDLSFSDIAQSMDNCCTVSGWMCGTEWYDFVSYRGCHKYINNSFLTSWPIECRSLLDLTSKALRCMIHAQSMHRDTAMKQPIVA